MALPPRAPNLNPIGPLDGTEGLIVIQGGRPKLGILNVIASYVLGIIPRIRAGQGAPDDGVGNTGDVYIDAASGDVFKKGE